MNWWTDYIRCCLISVCQSLIQWFCGFWIVLKLVFSKSENVCTKYMSENVLFECRLLQTWLILLCSQSERRKAINDNLDGKEGLIQQIEAWKGKVLRNSQANKKTKTKKCRKNQHRKFDHRKTLQNNISCLNIVQEFGCTKTMNVPLKTSNIDTNHVSLLQISHLAAKHLEAKSFDVCVP